MIFIGISCVVCSISCNTAKRKRINVLLRSNLKLALGQLRCGQQQLPTYIGCLTFMTKPITKKEKKQSLNTFWFKIDTMSMFKV